MRHSVFARLRFGQLRLMAAMEENGSMRRAAARMNITQPAVSKALKELETILGARLYERTASGVMPTPAGRVAARGARLLLAELGILAEEIRHADAGDATALRIGITPYLGASLLPDVLSRLGKTGEVGQITVEEDLAAPLLSKCTQGALDILIIMCSPDMLPALESSNLEYERLFAEDLAVVAAPGHPLARRRMIRIENLAAQRWVLPAPPSLTRRTLDEAFLHEGMKPPRPIFEATIMTNVIAAASSGLGLGACPASAAEPLCSVGKLVRLRVAPRHVLPPIAMVYRRLLSQHPRLAGIGKALRAELAAHGIAANR